MCYEVVSIFKNLLEEIATKLLDLDVMRRNSFRASLNDLKSDKLSNKLIYIKCWN